MTPELALASLAVKRRRARGTGGVSRRHDHPSCPPLEDGVRAKHRCRGRWSAQVELPRVDGRRRRLVLYGRTRGEVVAKLERVRRDLGLDSAGHE